MESRRERSLESLVDVRESSTVALRERYIFDDGDELARQCSCTSPAPSSPEVRHTEAPSTGSSSSWQEIPTPGSNSINGLDLNSNGSLSLNPSSASSSSWEDIRSRSPGRAERGTPDGDNESGGDNASTSGNGNGKGEYLCGRICKHHAHTGVRCPKKILQQEATKGGDSDEYMCRSLVCKHKGLTGVQCPKLARIARKEEEVIAPHGTCAELGPADRKYVEACFELDFLKAKLSIGKGPGDTAEFENSVRRYVDATLEYKAQIARVCAGKGEMDELEPAVRKKGKAHSRFMRENVGYILAEKTRSTLKIRLTDISRQPWNFIA